MPRAEWSRCAPLGGGTISTLYVQLLWFSYFYFYFLFFVLFLFMLTRTNNHWADMGNGAIKAKSRGTDTDTAVDTYTDRYIY